MNYFKKSILFVLFLCSSLFFSSKATAAEIDIEKNFITLVTSIKTAVDKNLELVQKINELIVESTVGIDRVNFHEWIKGISEIFEEFQKDINEIKEELETKKAEKLRIKEKEKYIKQLEERKRREEEARHKDKKIVEKHKDSDVEVTWHWPVKGYNTIITSYGMCCGKMHRGIDIGGRSIYGAEVTASREGTVIKVNSEGHGGGWGKYIFIDHGDGYTSRYGHLSSISVISGESVSQGQIIGKVGSTGFATGSYLHWRIEKDSISIDPLQLSSPNSYVEQTTDIVEKISETKDTEPSKTPEDKKEYEKEDLIKDDKGI